MGPRLSELASAAGEDRLLASATPVLVALRDHTKESTQLYRRQGDQRICVAAAERQMGLRDSIPVGATLSMKAGSAAQVLLAWEEPDRLHRGLYGASFNATMLSAVRRRGWAQSVSEREIGVASVSAPVRGPEEKSWPPFQSPVRSSAWVANPAASTARPSLRQLTGCLSSCVAQKKWACSPQTPPGGLCASRSYPIRILPALAV